jgi:cobalamin biosynthesis Mg chelatase CobN
MEDGKLTMYAGKSVALAEVFKFTVGKELFIGPAVCRLDLSAPSEESTDGGRLAVQHVSIVPEGGGPTTVMATAYQVERRAEVRPYEVVAETYKKRFRTNNFPVTPGQFDEMTRKLKDFFQQFDFKFEITPLQPGRASSAVAAAPAAGAPAPVAGASAVRRPTATRGSAVRTANRSSASEENGGPRAGGTRMWAVVALLAVIAAAAAAAAVYFLRD